MNFALIATKNHLKNMVSNLNMGVWGSQCALHLAKGCFGILMGPIIIEMVGSEMSYCSFEWF